MQMPCSAGVHSAQFVYGEAMTNTNIIIAGAGGRMGKAIATTATGMKEITISGAVDAGNSPVIGLDVGRVAGVDPLEVLVTPSNTSLPDGDVMIDFTIPAASLALVRKCAAAGTAMVIGTTGYSESETAEIEALSQDIAIMKSGNMSLGINLLMELVKDAAARLGNGFDIEIHEAHHHHKIDAPSGTALMLGDAAAAGRGVSLNDVSAHDKTGARKEGSIGFSVTRGGGIIGDHDVAFVSPAEMLTLSHRALDRSLFAHGALVAAQWVKDKSPGLYSMADVLNR